MNGCYFIIIKSTVKRGIDLIPLHYQKMYFII